MNAIVLKKTPLTGLAYSNSLTVLNRTLSILHNHCSEVVVISDNGADGEGKLISQGLRIFDSALVIPSWVALTDEMFSEIPTQSSLILGWSDIAINASEGRVQSLYFFNAKHKILNPFFSGAFFLCDREHELFIELSKENPKFLAMEILNLAIEAGGRFSTISSDALAVKTKRHFESVRKIMREPSEANSKAA